jgi:hypothetical protein
VYNARFAWAAQPTHVRLFIVYLIVAACITTILSLRLVRRLWTTRRPRMQISLQDICDGVIGADLLAQSALSNGVVYESSGGLGVSGQAASAKITRNEFLRTVQAAESRFSYLWDMCYVDVESLKKVATFTLLLSFLVVVYGAFPTFRDFCNNSKLTAVSCLVSAIELLLARFALGLSFCAALYLISCSFDLVMVRRKTRWTYLSALLKSELDFGVIS